MRDTGNGSACKLQFVACIRGIQIIRIEVACISGALKLPALKCV